MTTIETTADERFVGLGAHAEERLPAEWARRRQRAGNGLVIALLTSVQLAWLAALAYAAYIVIG